MDTKKTGGFIAELRREKGLTQQQLGERVLATNKTVSRWETGAYMPPIEALEMLSKEFGVTINELVAGKRLAPEEFAEKAEENLALALSEPGAFGLGERIKFFRKKWLKDHVFALVLAAAVLLALTALAWVMIKPLCPVVFAVMGIAEYCFLNNRMMTYVEQRAFKVEEKVTEKR